MSAHEFYTKLYSYTRNYSGVPVFFLTPVRRLIRNIASRRLPLYFAKHPADYSVPRREDVVVSFTSFPARIDYVYLTVESLLHQTILPSKLVLWLSNNQFPSEKSVPVRLRMLQNEVFEIHYVEGDIRSHKKYYYSLNEFPNKTIITTDDDIIYPPKFIEDLLSTSQSFPRCIVANIVHRMTYTDGKLNPYKQWAEAKPLEICDNVQIGAGGVVYPPHCLYKDCLNLELSQKLAPSVDDLWLNAMARLNGTHVIKTTNVGLFLPVVIPNNVSLCSSNVGKNVNDEQLKQIRDYYLNTINRDIYLSLSTLKNK